MPIAVLGLVYGTQNLLPTLLPLMGNTAAFLLCSFGSLQKWPQIPQKNAKVTSRSAVKLLYWYCRKVQAAEAH